MNPVNSKPPDASSGDSGVPPLPPPLEHGRCSITGRIGSSPVLRWLRQNEAYDFKSYAFAGPHFVVYTDGGPDFAIAPSLPVHPESVDPLPTSIPDPGYYHAWTPGIRHSYLGWLGRGRAQVPPPAMLPWFFRNRYCNCECRVMIYDGYDFETLEEIRDLLVQHGAALAGSRLVQAV